MVSSPVQRVLADLLGLLLFAAEPGFWLKMLERDDFTERLPRGVFGEPDYIILVDGFLLCKIYLSLISLLWVSEGQIGDFGSAFDFDVHRYYS